MNPAMWALVSQLIALLAIPHAAALGLAKVVSTSTRPSLTAASKTMDAAAYATLAAISAIVVRAYGAAAQKMPSPTVAQSAVPAPSTSTGGGITLETALWMYVSVYGFALIALGVVVYSLKTVLHTDDRRKVRSSLGLLFPVALVCWIATLLKVHGAIGFDSLSNTAKAASIFGPPAAVVLAVYGARVWDRRRAKQTAEADGGDR